MSEQTSASPSEQTSAPPIDPQTGKHRDVNDRQRVKGFVRPVRRTYVHTVCGKETTIVDEKIAAMFAKKPKYYKRTFCRHCRLHLAVDQFVWQGDDQEQVGS